MSQTLWIATRKGLFAATRRNGGWTLGSPRFLGDPVTMVLDDPRDGTVYAALNLGHFSVKLHRSSDRGATWQECGTPSYAFTAPADATEAPGLHPTAAGTSTDPYRSTDPNKSDSDKTKDSKDKAILELLWSLEAGGAGEPGPLNHSGIFRSRDAGKQWHEVSAARPSVFGFAVAVHPRDPETAWFVPAVKDERRVPVDAKLVVSRTRDGGKSFEVLDKGLPTLSYDLVYRHALDVDTSGNVLAFGSTTGGLWISEDGGDRWQTISPHLPPIYCVRFGADMPSSV